MKKLFTLFILVTTFASFAQAPQGFNYQATIRNATGALLANQNINIKFNIMLNEQTSAAIYSETHDVLTDDLAQVSTVVGTGAATTGTFSSIDWGNGTYFLGIEVNTGAGHIAMGTTQLMSVPFALFAQNVSNLIGLPTGLNPGDVLTWNGTQWTSPQIPISNLPVLETLNASAITSNSAVSGGFISSDGGFNITAKGICWSTNPNPTVGDNTTNNGTGASNFTSNITNLQEGITYYYRAYATNANGTSYGTIFSFKTYNVPSLSTIALTKILRISAFSGGNISNNGGLEIIEKGLVWSTSTNPTIALTTKTTEGGGSSNFISKLTSLTGRTTYYLRAYATNAVGTAYGNEIVFSTIEMEGIYKVIQSEYWRINIPRPDIVWTGQTRVIEFVSSTANETTYRFKEYAGPFGVVGSGVDLTHYFTIDALGVVKTPVNYNGVLQTLLGGSPLTNCDETPMDMINACSYSGPQNIIVKDDVNCKDKIYRTYGYLTSTGTPTTVGPREFYEVLERIID